MDDTSYFAFTSAGRLHAMRTGVGAQNVDVTLYLSMSRSQSSAWNLRCSTVVCPSAWASPRKPPGPEWYSGPVGM